MQLRNEDGSLKADGAHPGAVLQVPQHHLPVLPRAEQVAVVGRPAQRLHLARVAAQLARDAVCLDVENDDNAIVLPRSQPHSGQNGRGAAYTSRGKQVAAMTKADRGRMATACAR